jgi:hypothetical protein
LIGLVSGATGVVAIGVSSYLVVTARSDYREAKAAHCNAMNQCDAEGLRITSDARSKANLGTVFFGIGVAALGAGAFLYFTAPDAKRRAPAEEAAPEEARLQLVPLVTPESAGFSLSGSF